MEGGAGGEESIHRVNISRATIIVSLTTESGEGEGVLSTSAR